MLCPVCNEQCTGDDLFCPECGYNLSTPLVAEPVVETQVHATDTAKVRSYKLAKVCNCELPDVPAPDDAGFCDNCGSPCLPDVPTYTEIAIDDTLAMVSDIGRRHHTNEDCGTVFRLPNGDAILVVSDGVSSSVHPTDASNTITRMIKEYFLSVDLTPTGVEENYSIDVMHDAIALAHNAVAKMTPRGVNGSEATVVAAWVHDGKITYGWVGDSRIYRLDGTGLVQLTRDDSWIEDVVDAGTMSREDATTNKLSHAVTQVIGMKDGRVDIHTSEVDLNGPTKLMLCTDGLWNYYDSIQAMTDLLGAEDLTTAVERCNHYIDTANEAGGCDNVTAALLLI
jgi:serine/threonine protein phosphatase PrpC